MTVEQGARARLATILRGETGRADDCVITGFKE